MLKGIRVFSARRKLNSRSPDSRISAIKTLACINEVDADKALVGALGDPEELVRNAAVDALVSFPSVDRIVTHLDDISLPPLGRAAIAEVLSRFQWECHTMKSLLSLADDGKPERVLIVRETLGKIGESSVDLMRQFLAYCETETDSCLTMESRSLVSTMLRIGGWAHDALADFMFINGPSSCPQVLEGLCAAGWQPKNRRQEVLFAFTGKSSDVVRTLGADGISEAMEALEWADSSILHDYFLTLGDAGRQALERCVVENHSLGKRCAAIRLLESTRSSSSLPLLVQVFSDPPNLERLTHRNAFCSPSERMQAKGSLSVEAARAICTLADRSCESVLQQIAHNHLYLPAMDALLRIDAVDAYCQIVRHHLDRESKYTKQLLNSVNDPRAMPVLEYAMRSKEPGVKSLAAVRLAALGNRKGVDFLLGVVKGHTTLRRNHVSFDVDFSHLAARHLESLLSSSECSALHDSDLVELLAARDLQTDAFDSEADCHYATTYSLDPLKKLARRELDRRASASRAG